MSFTRRRSLRGGSGNTDGFRNSYVGGDGHIGCSAQTGGRRGRSYRLRGGRRLRSRRVGGARRNRTRYGGRRRRRGGAMGTALLPFALLAGQEAYARSLKRKRRGGRR